MWETIQSAVQVIRKTTKLVPEIGLILGSGLGELAKAIDTNSTFPYQQIPGFVPSTAPGHAGKLVLGYLESVPVVCMQGRLHVYEGHRMQDLVFPIRVMRALGVHTLILTNASGGINPNLQAGDLMLITDHINFLGTNPLIGPNEAKIGPRFPDMTHLYTPALQQLAKEEAQHCGIPLKAGVYLATCGPSYETPAEIRAFRTLGADAVGMSTVPEAIAAAHCGMDVLGISLISNLAAGMTGSPLSSAEVLQIAQKRSGDLQRLICRLLPRISALQKTRA